MNRKTTKHKIKRAIIPVAGFGTRMYPITRFIKKAFIPIPDGNTMKPILLKLVEELDDVGIEEIALVIATDEKADYERLFNTVLKDNYLNKLSPEMREYDSHILSIGKKIKYIVQEEQKGFGHAIYLCKNFAKSEPVLVVLGDTYFTSNIDKSCIEQIVDYYKEVGEIIIGMNEIPDDEIENVGMLSGTWDNKEKTKLSVNKIVEKPTLEYAKSELQIGGKCYGNFGMWIINNSVFNQIGHNIKNNITSRGEYQFVDAIEQIKDEIPIKALRINGQSHDVGNLLCYQKALFSGLVKSTVVENISKNNSQ